MRFERFEKPTEITLVCGYKVTVISALFTNHLWGSLSNKEFCIGGITSDLKRVYFNA